MITLTLPIPPKELHPNSHVPWQAKMRAKSGTKRLPGYREEVRIETLRQTRERLTGPVTAQLTFVYAVERDRDEDNLLAWCKVLFDGLVEAKVIAADDSKSLHHLAPAIEVVKGAKPHIRLTLEGQHA